jgi:hypothetical protein
VRGPSILLRMLQCGRAGDLHGARVVAGAEALEELAADFGEGGPAHRLSLFEACGPEVEAPWYARTRMEPRVLAG